MLKLQREIETVIWDFNGTLVDDVDVIVQSVNPQLEKRGIAPLTTESLREIFGFPIEEYYRRLGVTFEEESMEDLATDFFAEYAPRLRECRLHSGVIETLDAFAARSARQFVLSAMEEGMLHEMLRSLGIFDRFEAAYGLEHQKGDSKVARARRLVNDFRLEPEKTLLIGDTDHDGDVASGLGMATVLVATGHQSATRLRATGHTVIDSLSQLFDALP